MMCKPKVCSLSFSQIQKEMCLFKAQVWILPSLSMISRQFYQISQVQIRRCILQGMTGERHYVIDIGIFNLRE